jgi:hypothetical protein
MSEQERVEAIAAKIGKILNEEETRERIVALYGVLMGEIASVGNWAELAEQVSGLLVSGVKEIRAERTGFVGGFIRSEAIAVLRPDVSQDVRKATARMVNGFMKGARGHQERTVLNAAGSLVTMIIRSCGGGPELAEEFAKNLIEVVREMQTKEATIQEEGWRRAAGEAPWTGLLSPVRRKP